MAERAHKFVNRAPRYTLRPSDEKVMRFALENDKHNVFTTTVVNVSMTGMAFVTFAEDAPPFGAIIKVEFPAPGAQHVAWWGKVVRIAEHRPRRRWGAQEEPDQQNEVLVAIRFQELPEGHRHTIARGIQIKSKEITRQKRLLFRHSLNQFIKQYAWQLILFAFCTLFTFALLFWLSLPDERYDANRGSPWGQRFKGFYIEENQ